MPITSSVDHNRKCVFTTIKGTVTDEDMIESQVKLNANPDFNPEYHHFIDCTKIQKLKISPKGIQIITSGDMFSPGTRRAFVVSSDAVFGFSRMFQMYREQGSEKTEVFRDMEEAQHWLCLE